MDGTDVSKLRLRSHVFGRFLAGYTVDYVGDYIWFVSLSWAAFQVADVGSASVIVAAGTVPRMLLMLFGGVAVDRYGALRVAQLAQAGRIVLMVAMAFVAFLSPGNAVTLFMIALLFGVADAARMPAAAALPPQLLSNSDLVKGQALVASAGRLAGVVGAPLSGVILDIGGMSATATLNAVLFVVGFWAFFSLRNVTRLQVPASGARESNSARFREGLAYIYRSSHMSFLFVLIAVLNMALVGPLNTGIVSLAQQNSWRPSAMGLLLGAFGAGATAGALSLVRVVPKTAPAVTGLVLIALSSVGIGSLGFHDSLWAAVLTMVAAGVLLGPAGALLMGLVQRATAVEYMGRVMSLFGLATIGFAPLAIAGFGFLMDATGLPAAFLITGIIVAGLASFGLIIRSVRTLRLSDAHGEVTG